MLRLICMRCSWEGVFGDSPCSCGLEWIDFTLSWDSIPKNVFVIDEISEAGVTPIYGDIVWSLK